MNLVRSLERRLERLFEGVAGRVFSGNLHPAELAGKLAREADLARFNHETGPATGNQFTVVVHPHDLTLDQSELEQRLTRELTRHTSDQGLRLEGPVSVAVQASEELSRGSVLSHVEVQPGPPDVWARLVAAQHSADIGRNRVLVGRAPEADVVLPFEEVSRRHALLWRQGGQVWVRDLGSANGTTIDARSLGGDEALLQVGSTVSFAGHAYRFVGV